jgi:hypothetical protein
MPGAGANHVKFYLRDDQVSRLLGIPERRNLLLRDQFSQWRRYMTHETLTVRIAQALLAVGVTTASILVFQVAMVVG